uniref:Uncharacterized protein n=1 Tax=Anguilla anguilla TaxID=7936 RepID=A0A0E9PG40_ANGAN
MQIKPSKGNMTMQRQRRNVYSRIEWG